VTATLELILRHNAWANKTLLEHCATLGPDALDLAAAGTYGTLHATLQHIVGGEQFYIYLLAGERLGVQLRGKLGTIDELKTTAALTGARSVEIAANDDAERVIGDRRSDDWTTVGIVLAQLVHHGNEHRAQATTILGSHGRPTPKIGAWTYGIANGISKNDGD
jgi:uncharacterized damage-inducible protein DinB